jgi:uncharacterized OB-fold protein
MTTTASTGTGLPEPLAPFADLADDPVVTAVAADGTPRLVAARCKACGGVWFPMRPVCPTCATAAPEELLVGPAGTLYSYSTVHISSARETPYTLGYVDLPEGVRVLATVTDADAPLGCDVPCHLVVADDGAWSFATGGS